MRKVPIFMVFSQNTWFYLIVIYCYVLLIKENIIKAELLIYKSKYTEYLITRVNYKNYN